MVSLRRYPAFLQYDLQSRMPEIYKQAGAQGNLVITAPNPAVFVSTARAEGASTTPRPRVGAAEKQAESMPRPPLLSPTPQPPFVSPAAGPYDSPEP